MLNRGSCYRKWADAQLQCQTYGEHLCNGATIEVQARLSATGATQLFIGVYADTGAALIEVSYDNRPGESMTRAMLWGTLQARTLAQSGVTAMNIPKLA
jgi:hypothetical protein